MNIIANYEKKILITIDEVMHDNNIRTFASEFQLLIRKNYPVFLLMTGVYENIYAIQNDPALTFLLRTPKISLEPLSMPQIAKQYKRIKAIKGSTDHNVFSFYKVAQNSHSVFVQLFVSAFGFLLVQTKKIYCFEKMLVLKKKYMKRFWALQG